MIRNVVMVKLAAGADAAEVAKLQDGLRNLHCPGTVSYTVGDDLGLRDGNWSFGIVGDFTDEAAYRAYDADAEHNRLRAQLAPHVEQIARLQYGLP
jgi:Stress responsive A/B Barrel Domain